MPTATTRRILAYLRDNVVAGVDTLADAREFIEVLDDVGAEERAFLRVAFHDEACMEFMYAKFVGAPRSRRDGSARRRMSSARV
jgi:hypothetical protein